MKRKPMSASRVDHVRAAMREARRRGVSLSEEIGKVLWRMIESAQAGDVTAARLVLDRLGLIDGSQITTHAQIVVVTGVPARDGEEAAIHATEPNVIGLLPHEAAAEHLEHLGRVQAVQAQYRPDGRPVADPPPRILP